MSTIISSESAGMLGEGCMWGLGLSALANGILAGTLDYDQTCNQVDALKDTLKDVELWTSEIMEEFDDLESKINTYTKNLGKITDDLIEHIRIDRKKHNNKIKREQIVGVFLASVVTFILMLKLFIHYNLI